MSDLRRSSVVSFQGLPEYEKFLELNREEKAILIALLEYGEMSVGELIQYNKEFHKATRHLDDLQFEDFCIDKIDRLGFALIENRFVRYISV